MSGNVDHKGTSLSDGWAFSTENNALVGVDHDRNWAENAYTEGIRVIG